jgi:hypothetical protein
MTEVAIIVEMPRTHQRETSRNGRVVFCDAA